MTSRTGIAINPAGDDGIDPRIAKIAKDCWTKGNEAIAKENWDYAIEMYGKAVELDPSSLLYRQVLRGAEYRKYGNNGKGAAMAGMRLMGVRGKAKKARMSKNWKMLAEAAEEGLTVNPWDAQLNADLGDAARELGYPEVAIFAYEAAIKVDQGNLEFNKNLAEVLEQRGEYPRAVACWERIAKGDPNNFEARSRITALQTAQVIDRGKYETAGTTRDVMANKGPQGKLGRPVAASEVLGPGQSVENDLQRAIRKDPSNRDNYLKLADHYRREGDPQKVVETLEQLYEVTGGADESIRELLEDAQLDIMRIQLERAKEAAQQIPDDDELRQVAVRQARELLTAEIEIFSRRVERYPSDMRMKFELSRRYMRSNAWQKAIPLLQAARGDSRIKAEALIALGKCFLKEGKAQMAVRQFTSAVPEVNFEDRPDAFKDLHYTLARLYEELANPKGAEEHFQRVLEVDYNYKDTLDRLNTLQGGTATDTTGPAPDVG